MGELQVEEIEGATPELMVMLASAGLPTGDLGEEGRRFFRFTRDDDTVGFIGWEEGDGHHALLRSLVVPPARRGRGEGTAMMDWALSQLAAAGFATAWILTTSIEALALRQGFERIGRELAPEVIRNSRQFTALCPSSAILLRRELA